jgi:[ribosomal protein S5]-alanine N-acetyltransferase
MRMFPILTPRLILRDYTAADAPAVHQCVQDPLYWRHQRTEPPSADQIRDLVAWAIKAQSAAPRFQYFLAATDKATNMIVGEAVLKITAPPDRQGEIGFGVMPANWNLGLGSEICAALLAVAFKAFSLHRVYAQCAPENLASIRVMEKAGLSLEGKFRDIHFARGRWWSSSVYAVLESEYTG